MILMWTRRSERLIARRETVNICEVKRRKKNHSKKNQSQLRLELGTRWTRTYYFCHMTIRRVLNIILYHFGVHFLPLINNDKKNKSLFISLSYKITFYYDTEGREICFFQKSHLRNVPLLVVNRGPHTL